MKKLIIFVTIAAMISGLGATAFAETNVASNVTDGTAKIQITSNDTNRLYTVYFLKPGKVAADITDNTDAFAGVEQVTLTFDEGMEYGTGEVSFKLPAYGGYTAIIGGGELSGREVKLAYANPTEAANPIAELKAATAATIDSVLTKAEYNGTYWYADTENNAYKTNKSALMTALVEIVKTATDGEDVTDAYNKASVIAKLKTCTADEVYDALFVAEPVLGITYGEEVYKQTEAMSSAFVNLRSTEPLNTPAELTAFLEKAGALGKLNTATRDTVIGIIEGYNNIFGLTLSGDYAKIDKYSLAKKLVVTGGNTYDSIAEVQERFKKALEAVLKEGDTGTGGNTGGGGGGGLGGFGGGGGGGTTVGGSYPTQNPEVVSEDLMENNTGEFTDLDGAEWAKPYILYLAENGIMTGDGNGLFRPADKVLREEFLKTLIEALKLAGDEDLSVIEKFVDVDKDAWYAKYIAAGVRLGIINGKEESLFGIGDEITRQDAAVMIKRAVDAAGLELYDEGDTIEFTDKDLISDYAAEAVEALVKAGIINGYETGEFAPQNSILRSETAKMIYTMLSGINK